MHTFLTTLIALFAFYQVENQNLEQSLKKIKHIAPFRILLAGYALGWSLQGHEFEYLDYCEPLWTSLCICKFGKPKPAMA